jgi:hypothetical protein
MADKFRGSGADGHPPDSIAATAERWSREIEKPMSPEQWRQFKKWFIAESRHRIAFLHAYALQANERSTAIH